MMRGIRQQQLSFLGHVMRRHGLENFVATRRIWGRKGRGRKRLKYLNSLCSSLKDNVGPIQLIRAAEDKRALASYGTSDIDSMATLTTSTKNAIQNKNTNILPVRRLDLPRL